MRLTLAALFIALAATAFAQEGHPLVGTWHGTYGPAAPQSASTKASGDGRTDVTIVLEYDGKAITGMMNPGPDAIRFDRVTLDPGNWSVHFEATSKARGKAAPIVIDVTVQDVTNRRRTLVGTWSQDGVRNDFEASRDD